MSRLTLKLYVNGQSVRANSAVENLTAILNSACPEDYDLMVIDVQEDPQAAEEAFILATPTLVKLHPLPVRKVIGDLSNTKLVLESLDLQNNQAT